MNPFFVAATFIGMLAPVVAPSNNPSAERRRFWAGFVIAAISAFFITYPPDGKTGALLSLFTSSLMLIRAYFSTSYVKIRGKIYAFHVEDSRPDPSPDGISPPGGDAPDHDPAPDAYRGLGLTTAKKMWWLMVFLMALCAGNVIGCIVDRDDPAVAGMMAVFGVTLAISLGYMDASWEYPIARRQRLQFATASIITVGVFAVFYLGAYYAGKRWPLSRGPSGGYGAHSRHQKRLP